MPKLIIVITEKNVAVPDSDRSLQGFETDIRIDHTPDEIGQITVLPILMPIFQAAVALILARSIGPVVFKSDGGTMEENEKLAVETAKRQMAGEDYEFPGEIEESPLIH